MKKNFKQILLLLFLVFLSLIFAKCNKRCLPIDQQNNNLIKEEEQKITTGSDQKPIKILFAGDLMFDRHIRYVAQVESNDFILEDLKELLFANDLVVVNLEGPITDYESVSLGTEIGTRENYIFTFDTSVAKTLKDYNIRLVNIGNNHILNFGLDGLNQTVQNLKESDIKYFGNVGKGFDWQRFVILEIQGVKLGFVNYNQFVENGIPLALDDISRIRLGVDFVFLFTHWGREYTKDVDGGIQELAYKFIDSGVDAIIGSHPHVIRKKEVYKGKTIYYSLGNFVFDQYFSEDTKEGLLVEVKINSDTKEIGFTQKRIFLNPSGQTLLKE